jgi:aspartate carbamoyltransferase catalytic subunit
MPESIINYLRKHGVELLETPRIEDILKKADVLYMTRIQKERFPDPSEYIKVAGSYRITPDTLGDVKNDMIIMHPLPRVNEIDPGVDSTRHARYFQQAFYGVPIRMAVLSLVLGKEA